MALGDTIVNSGTTSGLVRRLIRSHIKHGSSCTIAVLEVALHEVQHYGIVKPKGRAGRPISKLKPSSKSPSEADAPSRLAVAARYVFNAEIFTALRRTSPDTGENWN